jgi:hypothetical protein
MKLVDSLRRPELSSVGGCDRSVPPGPPSPACGAGREGIPYSRYLGAGNGSRWLNAAAAARRRAERIAISVALRSMRPVLHRSCNTTRKDCSTSRSISCRSASTVFFCSASSSSGRKRQISALVPRNSRVSCWNHPKRTLASSPFKVVRPTCRSCVAAD